MTAQCARPQFLQVNEKFSFDHSHSDFFSQASFYFCHWCHAASTRGEIIAAGEERKLSCDLLRPLPGSAPL